MYGFRRQGEGERGTYAHPSFLRGKRHLVAGMRRVGASLKNDDESLSLAAPSRKSSRQSLKRASRPEHVLFTYGSEEDDEDEYGSEDSDREEARDGQRDEGLYARHYARARGDYLRPKSSFEVIGPLSVRVLRSHQDSTQGGEASSSRKRHPSKELSRGKSAKKRQEPEDLEPEEDSCADSDGSASGPRTRLRSRVGQKFQAIIPSLAESPSLSPEDLAAVRENLVWDPNEPDESGLPEEAARDVGTVVIAAVRASRRRSIGEAGEDSAPLPPTFRLCCIVSPGPEPLHSTIRVFDGVKVRDLCLLNKHSYHDSRRWTWTSLR